MVADNADRAMVSEASSEISLPPAGSPYLN